LAGLAATAASQVTEIIGNGISKAGGKLLQYFMKNMIY